MPSENSSCCRTEASVTPLGQRSKGRRDPALVPDVCLLLSQEERLAQALGSAWGSVFSSWVVLALLSPPGGQQNSPRSALSGVFLGVE